jgi:mono/diheme cytochrome c family protein
MIRLRWFLIGSLFTGVAIASVVVASSSGFSARAQPGVFENWIARAARSAAIPADARDLPNPVPDSSDVQAAARAHWADHCAGCHANDGSGNTQMGKGTYPAAPDMRGGPTQQMTDGELFFAIQNGVRFTAMPAWSTGSDHDAVDSWKLVRFIRHLPKLTAEEKKEMDGMTPRTPDEFREEEQEAKFLKGEESNEPQSQHHHH